MLGCNGVRRLQWVHRLVAFNCGGPGVEEGAPRPWCRSDLRGNYGRRPRRAIQDLRKGEQLVLRVVRRLHA